MKRFFTFILAFYMLITCTACACFSSTNPPSATPVVPDVVLPEPITPSTSNTLQPSTPNTPPDTTPDIEIKPAPGPDKLVVDLTEFSGVALSGWSESGKEVTIQVDEAYRSVLGETIIMVTTELFDTAMSKDMVVNAKIDAVYDTTPRTVYTSAFSAYVIPEPDPIFNLTVTFTGDSMLASYKGQSNSGSFNDYANKYDPTYFYEKVRHIFEADDFTIVNLENVFTDKNLKEVEKDHDPAYWFRSKTANVQILTSSSVEGVSIANNHLNDYGKEGRNDTIKTLTDAGLPYGLESQIMYFEKNGFVVAVICNGLWGEWQANNIIKLIDKAEEQSDYQIVFYHGGKEKIHAPEAWKQRASRKLVDAGADLVIGNHPHVLQPREIYNGVEILYSLGNFCYGGHSAPKNRTIIYQMTLSINENTKEIIASESNIIPCYVYTAKKNNYQPAPISDEAEKQRVLDFMDGKLKEPY